MVLTDENMAVVLQKVHELTQQNCPESAGTAWLDLFHRVLSNAALSRNPNLVLFVALREGDIPVEELLP